MQRIQTNRFRQLDECYDTEVGAEELKMDILLLDMTTSAPVSKHTLPPRREALSSPYVTR